VVGEIVLTQGSKNINYDFGRLHHFEEVKYVHVAKEC
jgi:hypothetical protein